jgi:hypothetical protein
MKAMSLWRTIRASIYSPEFYRSLAERRLSFSFKYYYAFGVALAIVFSVTVSLQALPFIAQFIDKAGQELISHFPEELTVTLLDGEVSTNVEEPYILPLPSELRESAERDGTPTPTNLLVIDTAAQASAESWAAYDTFILLTKRNIVVGERPEGRVQIQWLTDVPDVTIDRAFVERTSSDLRAFGKWISPLVVFGSWAIFMVLWTFTLAYLLVGGVLAWLVARVRKVPVSYRAAYQMAMHAWTPVALLLMIADGGIPSSGIPFLPTLLLLIVLIANIRPAPNGLSPVAEESEQAA